MAVKTAKKRSGSKAPADGGDNEPGKVRLNVRVEQDDYERLMIHALKGKKQPGELIGDLIRDHLKEWRVQANPAARSAPDDRPSSSDHVNCPPAVQV